MKNKIIVQDTEVRLNSNDNNFISLTDIARYKDLKRSDYILQNWMRSKETIIFLGLWEKINNHHFNSIEFDGIKNQAGVNSFILTPKQWVEKTNAIGIVSKTGRYGGTYAHQDIAFEFASWISAEFKLFLIVVLANLESLNAEFIKQGVTPEKRVEKLNLIAIEQLELLIGIKKLKEKNAR